MRACNGTKLRMYRDTMISNINALCHYYNHKFSNTIEYDKNTIITKHITCLRIYV